MKDWIDLVDLRDKHGIEIVCITEPFDETPAGKLNSNMLAAISQFYSDQLSQRTQAGVERRVQTGLFPGHAPYGYKNYREGGRGLVRIDEREAANVRRIYELYAYHSHTLEMLIDTMKAEGRYYRDHCHAFNRSKLHSILHDRSYLGEIEFRGQWHPGKHQPLIDHSLFERVIALSGKRNYFHYDLRRSSRHAPRVRWRKNRLFGLQLQKRNPGNDNRAF